MTDPNVAFLETCWVDDGVDTYLRTGSTAAMSIFDIPPVRTVQSTEEMRNEGGRWKVARTFPNSYEEGVTGCATEDDYEQPYTETAASDEQLRTIIGARQEAEQAYVANLISQAPTGDAEYWTGFQQDATSRTHRSGTTTTRTLTGTTAPATSRSLRPAPRPTSTCRSTCKTKR